MNTGFLFGAAKTHCQDLDLFQKIGFKPFEFNDQEKHFIGEYKLPHYDKASIKVSVTCMPAQFWQFEIETDEDQKFTIETGSGSLSDFFDSAVLVAGGMFSIK